MSDGAALDQTPDVDALCRLGLQLWRDGARAAALDTLAGAAARHPEHADARSNLGNALLELGRTAEALPHLEAAAALRADVAPTRYNLGNALLAAGRKEDAAARFRTALGLDPTHAGAHNNLGNALRALGRLDEAVACYRRAVALRPDLAGAHNNLGSTLLALHRPAEAETALRAALRCRPDDADACNNLGGALLARDRPEEALAQFRRAVALDAAQVQAQFGESLALLALGRYREGWAAYESRWLDPRFCEDERSYDVPLWRNAPGSAIAGRTLLLHAEQGLGDTIQFCRYAPLVAARGARVVLEVQPPLLRPPTATWPGRRWSGRGRDAAAVRPALPAAQPAARLRHRAADDPGDDSLSAPATRRCTAAWRQALGPRAGPRVGLAISGSPEHPEDALRSIPAALLRPLLMLPGVEFHVVQKEFRERDAAVLRELPGVRIHADRLSDFADTAALLAALDLLVSVDTSVAHLGGALGLPVWLLVQSNADFRWLRVRSDSPWYPTLLLFRQTEPQRWEPALARVADALRRRAAQARYDAS